MPGNAKVDPARVAAYIRWSTEDQGEGHTLEVQREHCRRVFREQGWQWQEALVYVDAGYSGTVLDRPALTRLRQAVQERLVDCVVVYRLDRLSRRTSDTLVLIQDEWDGLCHLVSATEPISTLNGMAEIVLPLLSTVGEMDRNRIISNTRAGKYAAAAKGRPMGKLPYGYRFASGRVEVDPAEGDVVRRIFREYRNGAGQNLLTKRLNQERIPSPEGAAWSQVTVGNILKNEAYVGRLVYAARVVNPRRRRHREEPRYLPGPEPIVVEGAYPRLIADEEFAAVARLRADRADRARGRRGLAGPFLLSRLVRCGRCGSALVGVRSSSGQTYYACQGATRHRADCDGRLIRQQELEEVVLAEVRRAFPGPRVERLVGLYREEREAAGAGARARLASVQAEVGRLAGVRRRWLGAFEQGQVDAALLSERLAELGERDAVLRGAFDEAAACVEAAACSVDEDVVMQAILGLDLWESMTHEQRKHLLRYCVREVTAYAPPAGAGELVITFWSR